MEPADGVRRQIPADFRLQREGARAPVMRADPSSPPLSTSISDASYEIMGAIRKHKKLKHVEHEYQQHTHPTLPTNSNSNSNNSMSTSISHSTNISISTNTSTSIRISSSISISISTTPRKKEHTQTTNNLY